MSDPIPRPLKRYVYRKCLGVVVGAAISLPLATNA